MTIRRKPRRVTSLRQPLDYFRAVLDYPDLTVHEQSVLLAMLRHAGSDLRGEAHPGDKLLSRESRVAERSLPKVRAALVDKGWLELVYSGRGGAHGRANSYRLAVPNGSNYSLGDIRNIPNSNDCIPNGKQRIPNGTTAITDALRNAPGDAHQHREADDVSVAGESRPQDQTLTPPTASAPHPGKVAQDESSHPCPDHYARSGQDGIQDGCAGCAEEITWDIVDVAREYSVDLHPDAVRRLVVSARLEKVVSVLSYGGIDSLIYRAIGGASVNRAGYFMTLLKMEIARGGITT